MSGMTDLRTNRGDKPPRMRWATYNRLLDKLRAADGVADERLRRVLINAQMSGFGAKRKSSARSEHFLTQAVIRKHSRDLPMGITDRAMEAWYRLPLQTPNRRVRWQATSDDENS
jgi:hypothetical protein